MSFQQNGDIGFYQFRSLDQTVYQAVFTRKGGVSPQPWASLNLGSTVGDDLVRVNENRRRALSTMDRNSESVFDVWQVHGVDVVIAKSPRLPETPHLQADVILTNRPGVTLMMRFADCVPILLHDPVEKVVGIAHAGWMGTVLGTARHAVEALQAHFGTKAENIRAAIGPSIGPDHYEVGSDVISRIQSAFGKMSNDFIAEDNGKRFFNLWAANRYWLENSGVHQVEVAGLCTACHTEDWFSHRAEKGRTGRFGALIGLV